MSFVTACTGMHKRCLSLPKTKGYYCLQTTSAVTPFYVQQKVDIHYNNKQETMIADLAVDHQGLQFVTLTPLGQTVLQIHDDNHTITQQSLATLPIDSAFLIGLLQWALWPSEAVNQGLISPLVMTDTAQGRIFRSQDTTIASIQYQDKSLPFRHLSIQLPQLSLNLDISELAEGTESHAQ